MAPANQYLAGLQAGDPSLATDDLRTLVVSRKQALSWYPSGQAYLELALAEIQLSARDEERAAKYLQDARFHLEQGLKRKPADPYAWTQVATLAALTQESQDRINSALTMAFAIAPYDPKLIIPRLGVALTVWPLLKPSLQQQVLEQVRLAWRTPRTLDRRPQMQDFIRKQREQRRQALVQIALDAGRTEVLRQALTSEKNKQELEQILKDQNKT